MNDKINKAALKLIELLMALDPKPDSLEGKAMSAVVDMVVEYEKKYD